MLDQYFLDLDERLKELENSCADLKRDYEARVVNWRWAEERWHSIQPLYWERHKRGRLVKEKPRHAIQYGFDEKKQVLVERTFGIMDEAWVEAFFLSTDEYTEQIVCSQKKVGSITRLYTEQGRPVYYLQASLFKRLSQSYYYEQDRLTHLVTHEEDRRKPRLPRDPIDQLLYNRDDKDTIDRLFYDRDGALIRIERFHVSDTGEVANKPRNVWHQKPAGKSQRKLLDNAHQELLKIIPEVLQNQHIDAQIYCLVLEFQSGERDLPPTLILGDESHRQSWLAQKRDPQWIWTPSNIAPDGQYHTVELPSDLPACHQLFRLIHGKQDWMLARQLLRRVARDLAGYNWSDILSTTPDFVAFPFDQYVDDVSDAVDEIRRCCSASVIEDLARRQLL